MELTPEEVAFLTKNILNNGPDFCLAFGQDVKRDDLLQGLVLKELFYIADGSIAEIATLRMSQKGFNTLNNNLGERLLREDQVATNLFLVQEPKLVPTFAGILLIKWDYNADPERLTIVELKSKVSSLLGKNCRPFTTNSFKISRIATK